MQQSNTTCTQHGYPMRVVRDMVMTAHPVLTDWSEQSITCFDLMYLESEAVRG